MGIRNIHTTIDYKKLIQLQSNSSTARLKINKSNNYSICSAKQENYPAKVRKLGLLGKKGRR